MVLLDEALAAVSGHEVEDFFVLEEIFCQLFSACEYAHDVSRADQWIRVGESIAKRRNLPAVSAFCRTHYGGVLTAAGRFPEADVTLTEAVRLWGLGQRSGLRIGAVVRLADLRIAQGRVEDAELLLQGLDAHIEAARPLAAVHLAKGRHAQAGDVLEHALAALDPLSTAAVPLWALFVEVHLANASLQEADLAADRLVQCAAARPNHYAAATAALARGRVCVATGVGDPQGWLRKALAGFTKADLPMEIGRSRLALADALVVDRPEAALAEARLALAAFEMLQAARDVDAATATLRRLGVRPSTARQDAGVLTKREAEVLGLLGHGLSNPEISDRLFISRKTVEHHVGNILAKLGLRGRADAAAYAARETPATK
jgi:DNA-binding CsgD family transcriptional regulator